MKKTPGGLLDREGTYVKVCGVTRLEDAVMCAAAGVDAIGLNFFPASKRYRALEEVAGWLPQVPSGLRRIALFVNARLDEIARVVDSGHFEGVQLHGDEAVDFTARVQRLGFPVLRAVALQGEADFARIAEDPADGFVLDAHAPGVYGGTGECSDWDLAARAVRAFAGRPMLLAGGLGPANVAAAVQAVGPWGVDTASGVEVSPGQKDGEKVRAFVSGARRKPD
jgi:phosphoribosylanthranilate isomerase